MAIASFLILALSTGDASPAAGQTAAPETFVSEAELARYRSIAPAWIDMAACRLEIPGAAPEGVVESPAAAAGEEALGFAAALSEDLAYRLSKNAESYGARTSPESIVDGDWQRIVNTRPVPYGSVCYITVVWERQGIKKTSGTAFFVGRRVLMTSAHLLFDRDYGGFADYVIVAAGRTGNSAIGAQVSYRLLVPRDWQGGKYLDPNFDIGWIVLKDRTLFNRVGFAFGYRVASDAELRDVNLNILSYPRWGKGWMYHDFEKRYQRVLPGTFLHYLDSDPGSSGAPLYKFNSQGRYVLGVHQGSNARAVRENVGTRITQQWFDTTSSIVFQNR